MAIFQIIISLLPSIVKLMMLAEDALNDKPKSGADKKSLVMEGTKAILDGVQGVSTGGQKETWDELRDPVSGIVDNLTSIMYPKDKPSIFDRIKAWFD